MEKGSDNGRGLTAAQDHWPGLQATACPSGRKGLTVLVTLLLL
ncbi:MAG: hypothetical protein RXP86_08260 [Acidilobus sp.]